MPIHHPSRLALALTFFLSCAVASTALAQTTAARKAPPKSAKKGATVKAPEPAPPAAAGPEQIEAAERVFYGVYECEFKQSVDIVASSKYPSYVDVKHGKADYLMKPVLSSTGAIRLEDVRGETLMVQISSKSMLLNVKTAQRIVDDCVSAKQRELIEAARAAKAQVAAASAAGPASGSAALALMPAAAAAAATATSMPAPAPSTSSPAAAAPSAEAGPAVAASAGTTTVAPLQTK